MTTPAALIRPEILALTAYHVPPAAGMIKLDAMENPFVLPESLRAELAAQLAQVDINRYPDPSGEAVKAALRTAMAVPEELELLLGNGSDELIQLIALALAKPGAKILAFEPSFVMYRMIATMLGVEYVGVPLGPDFALDRAAALAAIAEHRPALVFVSYPNNPTGNLFPAADVDALIRATPGLVVIDEAYSAFAEDSFLPRVAHYPNAVVMRTLSKLGLAGLRLGYLVGRREWLGEFDKLRLPYNINVLSNAAACFALRHIGLFDAQTAELRAEREALFAALQAMDGVKAYPSQANFVLVRLADADRVFTDLKAMGILVKRLHGGHPALSGCLRLTVGTPEENNAMLAALAASLAKSAA
ncbi:histidinol-phosphate transaminase [Chitinimonas lacunae]|uniref:Histidinol-phosphate aminotransferase n=1 Tax=Chitinimonas lacunae TaxID=1963018 RepID=A0ABV8MSY3_9NEIS